MMKAVPAVVDGKYRVLRRLGQGAMGSVHEAVTDAGLHVAVKLIMLEHAGNDTLVGRFEREARTASAIDTPHICKVLDAGTDEPTGLPYMVMELLDGEDLDQILKRMGPVSPDLALRVAAQACLALRDAHAARVLHRDIKPANLFLHRSGDARIVKLLDFGVAKIRPEVTRSHAETAGLTRTGSMLGSPLYMSPEQARGYKDIDFRSDIWSLGVVLYRMLAGRAPHGETEQLGDLIVLICTEPPPPLQDVAPWVPPQIASIVHRALRLRPDDRFRDAAEMYAALRALLPGGEAITEGMIRPLNDAERAVTAPRLDAGLTDAPPARASGSGASSSWGGQAVPPGWGPEASGSSSGPYALPPGTYPPPGHPSSGPPSPWSSAPPGVAGPVATAGGVAVGPNSATAPGYPPPGPRTPVWLVASIVGVALLASAGLGVYKLTSATPAEATPPPVASAAAPDDKPRTVTVVVLPASAAVEVDGASAPLSEGVLEISGLVGSVHKVKVTASGVEKSVRVVIAESGAVPPKIEVEAPAPPATARTTGAAPGPAKPKPKPTGTTPEDLRNQR